MNIDKKLKHNIILPIYFSAIIKIYRKLRRDVY